jgi:hypothetical protein
MLAYCGRPGSSSFYDRLPYIEPRYARQTIAESCSIWVALATAIISQTGSVVVTGGCESASAQRFDDRIARLQSRAELSACPYCSHQPKNVNRRASNLQT